jgi:hypothetical protein
MRKALRKAAKVLMDIHDAGEGLPPPPPKVRRRPRGLCHRQHCHFIRHEEARP